MEDTQQVKTRYEFTDAKATPFGGLQVFSEFLNRLKFGNIFQEVFGHYRRVRKYEPWENVALQMSSILASGERLYDTQNFASDPVVPSLFSSEEERNEIPADTTLRDEMLHIGKMDEQRQEFLFRLNELHFKRLGLKNITIDVDGTALPVEGHQEGAEKGYCPEEPGNRCFQSLSAICDETETTIAEQLRSGETHCAYGIVEFCQTILDRLSPIMDSICMRLDTGFFSDDLLKLFESYPNVTYEVGVPKHDWLKNKLRQIAYKSYHGSEREYTSFAYGEGLDGAFRYYNVERTLKESGTQLDCFDSDQNHTYRVVVTNKENMQPHTLFGDYNARGRCEKQIEELKNHYALGKMVSGDFDVTKALAWVSFLTFTLIGMLRKIAFRKEMAKYRLKRLRFKLFNAVAFFVTHARRKVLQIAPPYLGTTRYRAILQRIYAY
jgi:hypothetical protein